MTDAAREEWQRCFEFLRGRGVTRVQAEYSGSDDEGWITDVRLYGADGQTMAEGSERFQSWGSDDSLLEPTIDFLHSALEAFSLGWENDAGGAGTVEVDVAAGTAHFDHGLYTEPMLVDWPFDVKVN